MELRDGIRSTGAVRAFTDQSVDDATVAAILDDARFAPSGGNRQPWRVAVVADLAIRREMATLMQPIWDEYVAASVAGQVPFNAVDYQTMPDPPHAENALLDNIETVPVVLAVAADLRRIVAFGGHDQPVPRAPGIVAGGSIYPFCWNILLSARDRGLGGVMTTFLSARQAEATPLLDLPEHHALVATIFLGHPVHQPTRLTRNPVDGFAHRNTFAGDPFSG